jgi:DNA-binding response OmpR family regulator
MHQSSNIIIADTDGQFRNLLRLELIGLGFMPLLAFNADEAFTLAAGHEARLVILDTSLPELGAYDACLRMRRLRYYDSVPILLMTRFNEPRIKAAAVKAGISALLIKPFSVNDLVAELKRYLVDETDLRAVASWRRAVGGWVEWSLAAEPSAKVLFPPIFPPVFPSAYPANSVMWKQPDK